jgi:hypothetical protein
MPLAFCGVRIGARRALAGEGVAWTLPAGALKKEWRFLGLAFFCACKADKRWASPRVKRVRCRYTLCTTGQMHRVGSGTGDAALASARGRHDRGVVAHPPREAHPVTCASFTGRNHGGHTVGTLLPTSQKRASALQGGGRRCSFARWDPHRALALADAGALLCGAVRSRSFSLLPS